MLLRYALHALISMRTKRTNFISPNSFFSRPY